MHVVDCVQQVFQQSFDHAHNLKAVVYQMSYSKLYRVTHLSIIDQIYSHITCKTVCHGQFIGVCKTK